MEYKINEHRIQKELKLDMLYNWIATICFLLMVKERAEIVHGVNKWGEQVAQNVSMPAMRYRKTAL